MKVFVITYCYDDCNGFETFSHVFSNLNDAITDAQIAQDEYTDRWDDYMPRRFDNINGVGRFLIVDDNNNILDIFIQELEVK